MSTDNDEGRVLTPEARWIYPHLFEPRQMMVNGKPKGEPQYELEMLLEPDSINELKAKAAAVARAKFPGLELKAIKFPFKSGDQTKAKLEAKGKKGDHYAGKVVLRAKTTHRPQVVDKTGADIIDKTRVYGGCWGIAEVNFVAYNGNGENIPNCVTAYLNCALKTRDGERIGGRDAKTTFAGIIGKQTQEDPTAGLDDEIPF